MDGLFHGKPYFLMDDLGGKSIIFGNIQMLMQQILKRTFYLHKTMEKLSSRQSWRSGAAEGSVDVRIS